MWSRMNSVVEGEPGRDAIQTVNGGKFDKQIAEEKTELSAEELKEQEEERKKLMAEVEAQRAEFTAKANEIISKMAGKERAAIKHKLLEAEIPKEIIDELLPAEGIEGAAPAAAPAEGEAPAEAPAEEKGPEPDEASPSEAH